jgi:glycosyltransferase involved in cell wall biosynthesis
VSVVIPIYRVERYLVQCVESVLNQTMRDLEVILVDDGSPDACPQIADDFAARDQRVTVIHQANQGLSGARNSGLRRARGRLVAFLDSDDFWEGDESLARCVAAFDERPELDVLFFDALRYYEATDERVFGDLAWDRDRVAGASNAEAMHYMVECGDVRPSACTKVIRRQFLVDNGLDFKPGVFSEDVEWFLRLITHPGTYDYLPLPFYMYRKNRTGSITNTIGAANVSDVLDTVLAAGHRILASPGSEAFKRDYLSYCCYQYTIALALYAGLKPADRKAVQTRVREAQFLLAYDGYRNSKRIAQLVRIIGLEATARALHSFLVLRARRNRGR